MENTNKADLVMAADGRQAAEKAAVLSPAAGFRLIGYISGENDLASIEAGLFTKTCISQTPRGTPVYFAADADSPTAADAGGLSSIADDVQFQNLLDDYTTTLDSTYSTFDKDGSIKRAAATAETAFVSYIDGLLRAARPTAVMAERLPVDSVALNLEAQLRAAVAERDEIKATAELHAILAQYPPESWAVRNQAFEEAAQYHEALARNTSGTRVCYVHHDSIKAIRAMKSDRPAAVMAGDLSDCGMDMDGTHCDKPGCIMVNCHADSAAVPRCPHCGTHEVSMARTCHNSACSSYAREETTYEGWKQKGDGNAN